MSQVTVGILNWNQKEDTLNCLESLRKVKLSGLEQVVVDNGSTDGSVQAIREKYPDVVVLENNKNRGAAGGRNDFLNYFLKTEAQFGMFLDNDAVVPPECFQFLLEEIHRDPKIGVIGLKTYFADQPEMMWSRGGALLNPWSGRFEKAGYKEKKSVAELDREVDSVPGGFSFFKREVAEKVPSIDERYFIYFEDSDWCFRVREAGFKLMVSEKAYLYHQSSSSLGNESPLFYYYRTRNQILFMAKNAPWHFIPFLAVFLFYRTPRTLLTLWLSKRKMQMKAIFTGIADAFTGRWYICPHSFLKTGRQQCRQKLKLS